MTERELERLGAEMRVQCMTIIGFADLLDRERHGNAFHRMMMQVRVTGSAVGLAANVLKFMAAVGRGGRLE